MIILALVDVMKADGEMKPHVNSVHSGITRPQGGLIYWAIRLSVDKVAPFVVASRSSLIGNVIVP